MEEERIVLNKDDPENMLRTNKESSGRMSCVQPWHLHIHIKLEAVMAFENAESKTGQTKQHVIQNCINLEAHHS
ncbi:hypothetical protein RCL_jg9568.t1 [Rhizophagus clarus]|uniref:Uncharacterized protein n=1 Tax=Rhizophagus clarus TaxID=94130 RepID=A0A8H3LCB4_9GLOM|nr:hypothetical protein RCL_jg9568.t1 [Rhizophagus clarus]